MKKTKPKAILAIDFDETIAYTCYPDILGLKEEAKKYINRLYDEGYYIIINTCRTGEEQEKVKNFLDNNNIQYHLINENHPKLVEIFKSDSRKISCDLYLDDKNVEMALHSLKNKGCPWKRYYNSITEITNDKSFKSILNFTYKEEVARKIYHLYHLVSVR